MLLEAKKEQLKEMKNEKETTQTTSTLKSASTSKSTSKSKLIKTKTTTTTNSALNKEKVATDQKNRVDSDVTINNYGQNLNLKVNQTKFRNVPKNSLKNILFWNEALPLKLFGLIFVGE